MRMAWITVVTVQLVKLGLLCAHKNYNKVYAYGTVGRAVLCNRVFRALSQAVLQYSASPCAVLASRHCPYCPHSTTFCDFLHSNAHCFALYTHVHVAEFTYMYIHVCTSMIETQYFPIFCMGSYLKTNNHSHQISLT